MKTIKRAFTVFIIVAFILVPFTSFSYADASTDVSTKADILNKLSILSGVSDGNYMLEKPLYRSEAAAFITRLIGKTSYVLENSDTLRETKYPDVDSTKWYAPYIGYCSDQGIIAGDSKGNYVPNGYISEKAFLKLIIAALGYEYGPDYTWSNIYKKAFEIGLVDDKSYLTRTQDNNRYTRKDAVLALYNSLTKTNIQTKTTVLQNLINEKVISKEEAIASGFGEDSAVGVTQIKAISQTCVFLLFDRNVQDIAAENIKVYETGNASNKLDVSIQAKQPNTLVLTTSNQTAYLDYTVEINNVAATGGILTGSITAQFEGYRASELKSDFFRISKVEPVNKSTLNVYFTHPVGSNSEIASYYEILEGTNTLAKGSTKTLTAKYATSPDNLVMINLQGVEFTEGKQYTLKVSGDLSSTYGVKLNEGQGDSLRFSVSGLTGDNPANTSFVMSKITLLDYKTMQLEFNMEVHPTRAQQVYSYYLTDPYGNPVSISKAVVGGSGAQSGKIIYLTINGAFIKTSNYKIIINEIDDISKQYSITEKEYAFNGAYPERTPLKIQSATALNRNTVSVTFDRQLDPTMALTKELYTITGISQQGFATIPAKVMFDSDNQNRVNIYLPTGKELISNNTYKVTILSIMKDNLGNTAGTNMEATFFGSSATDAKPFINDAVIISKDTIKITTNENISSGIPNILASNYSLEYLDNGTTVSKEPLIVGYINSTTLILKFDVLDFNKEYTLIFDALKDSSELFTRTAADGQNTVKVRLGK